MGPKADASVLGHIPSHFLSDLTASFNPFLLHCQVLLSTDPLSSVSKNKLRSPVSLGEPLSTWQPQTTSLSLSYRSQSSFLKELFTLIVFTSSFPT